MHMVISNAHAGDPYKIDTLFIVYGQHVPWKFLDEPGGVLQMLNRYRRRTGYVIRASSIPMRNSSADGGPMPDLDLPEYTYLERHIASAAGRPISERNGAADANPLPFIRPDRDVRVSVLCCLDLGA